jgi:hypothetical protein
MTPECYYIYAFPSMFVSSLREFPENYVYRPDGFNFFIEYLHRKLLTTNFSRMILKVLKNRAFIGFVYLNNNFLVL